MKRYLNWIGGELVPAQSGRTFQTYNPANTNEVFGEYPQSAQADVSNAIAAAKGAFPSWCALTPVARGSVLSKAGHLIEARKSELAESLTREEGKTLTESTGEVQRAADIFRF